MSMVGRQEEVRGGGGRGSKDPVGKNQARVGQELAKLTNLDICQKLKVLSYLKN